MRRDFRFFKYFYTQSPAGNSFQAQFNSITGQVICSPVILLLVEQFRFFEPLDCK